jgi:hypothetical protein
VIPNFIRDALLDEYDHTAYKVYDRDAKTPGKTKNVDDWEELQRRIEARYNPVYGLFLNLTRNGYLFDDGTTQKTGYLFNEMPYATMKDQLAMYWTEQFDYHPEDVPDEERDAYNLTKCEQLCDIIDNEFHGDVQTALDQGFMIPYDLRWELRDYCYRQQNFAENHYNQLVSNGLSGTAKQNAWTDYRNRYTYYKGILENWVWNDDIPWSDAGYVKIRTNSETLYYYKDTGAPATLEDLMFLGPSAIETRYVPRGDRPNSLALFTTPINDSTTGYNYERKPYWLDESEYGTDVNRIFDQVGGTPVPYGRDEDVPMRNAIFGGSPTFKTNEPIEATEFGARNEPTIGYRGYVPFEESLLWDLPNYNGTDVGAQALAAAAANALSSNGNGDSGSGNDNGNGSGNGSGSGSGNSGNGSKTDNKPTSIPDHTAMSELKRLTRQDVGGGALGDLGVYIDKDHWTTNYSPSWYRQYSPHYGSRSYRGSYTSTYNPKIYSTRAYNTHISGSRIGSTRTNPDARSINADRPATMYSKSPNSTRIGTYLNPGFETKGSREAYKRQDI